MFTDKRLKNSEWFELSDDDLSTVLMRTIDLIDSMGFGNRKVDLHELFPSPQESAARLDKIEIVKTEKREATSKEPTDGMLFCSSRYTAAEKLSADMAREIEGALGKEEYDPKWSQALLDYADALDTYTGEDTFSVIL